MDGLGASPWPGQAAQQVLEADQGQPAEQLPVAGGRAVGRRQAARRRGGGRGVADRPPPRPQRPAVLDGWGEHLGQPNYS